MIPTLRRKKSETAYQKAKSDGKTHSLTEISSIQEWSYWRLVLNEFPYDMAFKTHHMLLPKREFAERFNLHTSERLEFEQILKNFVYPNYDLWFENTPKRRSDSIIYHIHLVSYVDDRKDMDL